MVLYVLVPNRSFTSSTQVKGIIQQHGMYGVSLGGWLCLEAGPLGGVRTPPIISDGSLTGRRLKTRDFLIKRPEMGYQYPSKLPNFAGKFQRLDLGKHQSILSNGGWVDKAAISFLEVTYCPEMWRLVSMFLLGWRWRNYPKLCVDPIKNPDYIFSVSLFQGMPWFDVPQWDTSAQTRLCASTSTYGGCPCNHVIIFIRNKPSLESMLFGGIQIAVRKLHRTGSTLADMEASWQSGYPVVIWSDVLENLHSYRSLSKKCPHDHVLLSRIK